MIIHYDVERQAMCRARDGPYAIPDLYAGLLIQIEELDHCTHKTCRGLVTYIPDLVSKPQGALIPIQSDTIIRHVHPRR